MTIKILQIAETPKEDGNRLGHVVQSQLMHFLP
jgi:hypothetical protein